MEMPCKRMRSLTAWKVCVEGLSLILQVQHANWLQCSLVIGYIRVAYKLECCCLQTFKLNCTRLAQAWPGLIRLHPHNSSHDLASAVEMDTRVAEAPHEDQNIAAAVRALEVSIAPLQVATEDEVRS